MDITVPHREINNSMESDRKKAHQEFLAEEYVKYMFKIEGKKIDAETARLLIRCIQVDNLPASTDVKEYSSWCYRTLKEYRKNKHD